MEKMKKIRAHHLLCIPRFYRGGYDKEFAKNMKKVVESIRKNPAQKIILISQKTDILCNKCPHRKGKICTQKKGMGQWVVGEDKKVMKYLKLKPNSIHKAKDVYNLAMKKINDKKIKSMCKGCVFVDSCVEVGINKSFQKDLMKK